MAKKTPPNYYHRYNALVGWGLLAWESRAIATVYSMAQIRSLTYLQSFIRSRRLFVSNMRRLGYSNRQIIKRIYELYRRNEWLTDDGKPDVWKLIRAYRKPAIDNGEYVPPKRKGSHHPPSSGISKGQINEQRRRRKKRLSELEKYDRGRMR